MNTKAQIDNIYEKWHQMIMARDADSLMKLYADNAVIESSAVLVFEKEPSGTLQGKANLRDHFQAFFDLIGPSDGMEWYKLGTYQWDGNRVQWEYPSKSPYGEQLDVVESFDVEDGLITYHRVYWGYVGFKLLSSVAEKSK